MAGPITSGEDSFLKFLNEERLPEPVFERSAADIGLNNSALKQIFESQVSSRRLDLEARRLGAEKRGYYSIGSSGHEGNAALAHALRVDDMAFLHYRSGAFLIERAQQLPGSTPLRDLALSFVASSEDPISGGRHKVLGSKSLFIPPQTSTIASQIPKAVGAAFSISLARSLNSSKRTLSHDGVILCSFGDASANHSTAQGAINTAAWTAYRNIPLPLIFLCEDNGIGISVPTPDGWTAANFSSRPGLHYISCDGRDLASAFQGAKAAEEYARMRRKPVFLHMRTVRLMGHAGSDLESAYRPKAEIEDAEANDPLLHSARRLIESANISIQDIKSAYDQIAKRVYREMEDATARPKLKSANEVIAPLIPPRNRHANKPDIASLHERAAEQKQHMSRIISLTLTQAMEADKDIIVFGEDVGKKGGVYGATVKLQQNFGATRVFDTVLDEQAILGMAIGLAHNNFLPIPEIQFLAYVHNAEDQIRGEAASLSFFSDGQFNNPMVIRIAGLGYQKGFGGHFHNDNSVNIFRDIPGLIVACPSNAADAVRLLRACICLAREENRVVVFIEPIALYGTKDLHEPGDQAMAAIFNDVQGDAKIGETTKYGEGTDLAILSYGNGAFMSRRCAKTMSAEGISTRVIDMRWLKPLPIDSIITNIGDASAILIVDECRRTGSIAEELVTRLTEAGLNKPLRRLNGEDTYIPLGPAAETVLISEADIIKEALALCGR